MQTYDADSQQTLALSFETLRAKEGCTDANFMPTVRDAAAASSHPGISRETEKQKQRSKTEKQTPNSLDRSVNCSFAKHEKQRKRSKT